MKQNLNEKNIPQIDLIDKEQFYQEYFLKSQPLVIRQGINDWPALSLWSPEYFARIYSNKKIKIAIFNKKSHYREPHMEEIAMKDAVSRICTNTNSEIKYYILQQSIPDNYEEIMQDFQLPTWIEKKREDYFINLWFGEAGNKTPLHFDSSHNFLAQVYGRKKVMLFPPEQSEFLSPMPLEEGKNFHLSQLIDLENPDYDQFPKFKYATPISFVLSPGEVLFIPSGWWHYVTSIDIAISINFFWATKIDECNPEHLLRNIANYLYENNRLDDVRHSIDLNNFPDYKEVALYLINRNNKWLALLFLGAFIHYLLEKTCLKLNIPLLKDITENNTKLNMLIKSHHNNLGIEPEKLETISSIILKAKKENNEIINSQDINFLLSEIKELTIKIHGF